MILTHYSAAPLTKVRYATQSREYDFRGKPNGLWLSVDQDGDGWRDWCISEGFGLSRLTHVHEVTLAPNAKLLHLSGAAAIDDFSDEYGARPHGMRMRYINWRRVAARYHGIVIAPYVWARRLDGDAFWYYTWDCASGCIWNPKAIASITLREIVEAPNLTQS